MALANEGEGARAPSLKMCAEPGCERQQWAEVVRGKLVVYSALCDEHSKLKLVDVPPVPVLAHKRAKGEPSTFREAVAQRHREREGS
jgi:hypothetical protein